MAGKEQKPGGGEKIVPGGAITNESGKSAGQIEQPSAADLKRDMKELEAKVEAARLLKEKNIKEKVSERESLIAEAESNEGLLKTAQETLEYFISIQDSGLLDEADAEKLKDLQALVLKLENQRTEIKKRFDEISSKPEILEKLQDAAGREDVERTVKNLTEQKLGELNPQIDALAEEIKNLAHRKDISAGVLKLQEQAVSGAWEKVKGVVKEAKAKLGNKSQFGDVLDEILEGSPTPEELYRGLASARKKLGLFQGKEKSAIDLIFSHEGLFNKYYSEKQKLKLFKQQDEQESREVDGIAERYEAVMLDSWDTQNRINELQNYPNGGDFPRTLNSRLHQKIKNFAEGREGNKMVGGIWDKVEKRAGEFLSWKNPREVEKKR
ncbi:MAG: hypothetical protein WC619_04500 [Patescibacteria group bacterium]